MLNFSEIEQVKQKIDLMEKQLKQKDIIIENQKRKISAIESEIALLPDFLKTGERKTCFYIESCNWACYVKLALIVIHCEGIQWGNSSEHSLKLEHYYYGNILVKMSGSSEWQGVCDDEFDMNDANVICHMLGYLSAKSYKDTSGYGKYETWEGQSLRKFGLDDIKCNGTESSLEQCPSLTIVSQTKKHNCADNEYAGVECNLN